MSGTVADISLVHWKQQWLENGTLYFHVSMSSAEQLSRATPPSLQEPSEIVEEQMHILHISVMVSQSCQWHHRGQRTSGRGRWLAAVSWWEGGDKEQGGESGLQMSVSLLGWAPREGEMCLNGPGGKKKKVVGLLRK